MRASEASVARFAAMGTRVELHLFGGGAADALSAAQAAIAAVENALTIHRPSPTTALNRALATGDSAAVDEPLLFDALLQVDALWQQSGGLFDPSLGAWSSIALDRAAGRVSATQPLTLDFGGFGKGFALDRAVAALRLAGVTHALLSAGESSIAVIGQHPLGGAWPFAIPHPEKADAWLVELEMHDASLSISSTIGAGAAKPGRAAMVRPVDGTIVTEPATAVALAATGAEAEAMSTALLVANPSVADRLRAADPDRRFRFPHAAPVRAERPLEPTA
ncbi:FAD:protein FMN transferase [Sphingomonas sp. HT-1]|uniref:FAD:protein FMN transferase n=1 Tax=unclassified Sphingomonas TaxID=196159 RepID=UPI0002D3D1DB|nr:MULTISPECIES: FAD:protein FMN transferase [unclassified Sphingomonas]KTF68358.1 ApbE family lipoprotein [Sphingomonas sp. WG]